MNVHVERRAEKKTKNRGWAVQGQESSNWGNMGSVGWEEQSCGKLGNDMKHGAGLSCARIKSAGRLGKYQVKRLIKLSCKESLAAVQLRATNNL